MKTALIGSVTLVGIICVLFLLPPRQPVESQEKQLNDRAESLQELLDAKEDRLRAQFIAMERALAGLQAQQSALAGLSILPTATGSLGVG